ncbi:linear amide C-N hydrolase [Legionella bononiensis]|uniref:Linear amide C-N hydrolase n=1 Tax=Legionella bononiensis TaxID=2793102 RepID=A0ABS1WD82_9GAMM|nr:linear amide C-N hydrolase [Legionella bononiensis]MBL7481199.1 linear amide C-N hydrolase [Legionella bononiensis]MBL7527305.1 linear amide C-N hydrolase [Legionella bononiensis]MBL7562274.1 linear amide C-N hydrolase [Legionella bononiensis]
MKLIKTLIGGICAGLIMQQASACSSAFVPVYTNNVITNVIGFRTLDFEDDLPLPIRYGEVGDVNTSSIDVDLDAYNKAATWINTYQFIGKPASDTQLMDGLNTAGVYVGALYLPNITVYPRHQINNMPTLSVFDIINYVLGTSGSVAEALTNLSNVQVSMGTIRVGAGVRKVFPLHFHIEDKTGASAVIEFLGGVMQVTTTGNLQVMGNSPEITWQQQNYDLVSSIFVTHNQYYEVNGEFMNGSGYLGLPGDSMPPSRYVRLRALLAASPQANTDVQATYVANAALYAGAFVPVGINTSPTYWSSLYNLTTGSYKITNYLTLGANNDFYVTPTSSPNYENTYNVNSMVHLGQVHAIIQQAPLVTVITYEQAETLMAYGTSPTATYVGRFFDGM